MFPESTSRSWMYYTVSSLVSLPRLKLLYCNNFVQHPFLLLLLSLTDVILDTDCYRLYLHLLPVTTQTEREREREIVEDETDR